ncbi:phosphoesterase family-domain-containing protein [Gautieria morchelliformis]|nr:phosphoesterase family-domain-containing protein [Gautieria morchelliformis]
MSRAGTFVWRNNTRLPGGMGSPFLTHVYLDTCAMVSRALATLAALPLGLALASPTATDGNARGASFKNRIKNVVVLVEENRSFDNIAGGFTYSPDIDGLVNTQLCNPINVTDPGLGSLCATDTLPNVDGDDPNHGVTGVNMEVFSTFHPSPQDQLTLSKENMMGFLEAQQITFGTTNITRASESINFYNQNDIPVLRTLAENFVLFDKWFCAVPGPTDPNRAYITSGTSHGHGQNDVAFSTAALPQRSVFQQLSEANITWINYSNASFAPDSLFYTWTQESGAAQTNIKPLTQFFTDAAAGTLPQFTYINPECCNVQSFHPPSPATEGEFFVKTIYETLRASPQWDETLFILTFDEHGGFADHVPPPVGVPPGDNLTYTETAPDGLPFTLDFTRLGVRVPAMLISPWVGAGVIEHEGTNAGGAYSHTSILAFVARLWDLDFLTPRVAFSSTFEHLILDAMRETPTTLPEPVNF